MSSTLEQWLRNGWLREHQTNPAEVAALVGVADRDLASCRTAGLHTDWQFTIAYNAALRLATVALAIRGYKAERGNHHYRVIGTLPYTLRLDDSSVTLFDLFRKKRNISDYEQAGTLSERDAQDMRRIAENLRKRLAEWICQEHPAFRDAV